MMPSHSAAIGITLLIAPWIGGRIKGFIAGIPYVQDNIQLGEFRIIFALSALGLWALFLYIVFKKEEAKLRDDRKSKEQNPRVESKEQNPKSKN